ncbi:MAG: endolytic transglycosylase MltG [Deltaproteobacteria bacterium]|jgi:UPF0755 protein|nr:endolytic transglycosylase MltG [Deltaproteobacteria bacterium]
MIKKFVSVLFLLVIIGGVILGASFYIAITKWNSPEEAAVNIKPGTSVRMIADQLAVQGVIKTPRMFEIYVRLKGLGGDLKAGTYDIPAGSTMLQTIDKLASGDVRQYEFTVIEGWTIKDIAKALKGKPYLENDKVPADFLVLVKNKELIGELGFEGSPSLEGYLFPETYRVGYPLKAKDLIVRLTDQFKETWKSLVKEDASLAGRTKKDVVALASIVEKETAVDAERPLVAGVFANRLEKGIALQSDPTIIYGLPNYDGNIRKRDISNPHPYNTYVHRGLPPGAISNPGKASLAAALKPEKTEYIYFVSKNDGSHHFSKDLSEHLKMVRRYQIMGEGKEQ